MSDRQDTPITVTADHRPDRPIVSAGEDKLGRDGFVRRLARALVTPGGRASGVVVGLTGPWGSGKSSILNLLEEVIKEQHPSAVVVRFDPWLVSGRDDIITQFFAELLATIKTVGTTNPQTGKVAAQLTGRLTKYAANLAPATALLGLPIPGLREALKAVGEALDRTESLADQHKDLKTCLEGVEVPIVVLIDELDRVEDGEVRAVAQLVRAVADFPGLSYVLAYDRRRVVEALGGVADTEGVRGSAYLEKIVQLELPLPVSLTGETDRLLEAELAAAAPTGFLPAGWRENRRFLRCLAISSGVLLGTPRDVRRVCGMYAVLAPMVSGEVDWADLFGYTVLLAKAPGVIDAIRQQPELVAVDAPGDRLAEADWEAYVEMERASPDDLLLRLGIKPASPPARLLGVLFPRLVTGTRETELEEPVDGLRHYRALMTVLRLGLLPDAVSRAEVQELLRLNPEAKLDRLRVLFADGRLASFLDRLLDIYADLDDPDPDGTLRVLGGLTRTLNPATLAQQFAARRCGALFDEAAKRVTTALGDGGAVCQGALVALIEADELDGPAGLLRHQFFAHGLFGCRAREPENTWLPEPPVRGLSLLLGGAVASGEGFDPVYLLQTVRSPHPLLLASEVGAWTPEHRDAVSRCIETSERALQSLLLLFFGDGIIEAEVLNRFVDAKLFRRLVVAEHRDPAWMEPTLVAARAAALRTLGPE